MIAKYFIQGESPFPYDEADTPVVEKKTVTDDLHGLDPIIRDFKCDKDDSDNEEGGYDSEGDCLENSDEDEDEDGRASNRIRSSNMRRHKTREGEQNRFAPSAAAAAPSSSSSTSSSTSNYTEDVYTSLPLEISSRYPSTPHPIGDYTKSPGEISSTDTESLLLPLKVLEACWAARRLSIVGRHDKRSYCFTHSYGRLFDKSSGSVLWEVSLSFFYFFIIALFYLSSFFSYP